MILEKEDEADSFNDNFPKSQNETASPRFSLPPSWNSRREWRNNASSFCSSLWVFRLRLCRELRLTLPVTSRSSPLASLTSLRLAAWILGQDSALVPRKHNHSLLHYPPCVTDNVIAKSYKMSTDPFIKISDIELRILFSEINEFNMKNWIIKIEL